jgi:DNA-binding LacI/PurR family transcriptional regulator
MESKERQQGYRDALQSAGIAFDRDIVVAAHYTRREAFRGVQNLLTEHPDLTAIFAANADMALGAADAVVALGMKIPEDISLVAFDDAVEMEEFTPGITAVRQFPYKMGYAACEMLVNMLSSENKARKIQCKVVDTEFISRGSVAPPR